MSKPEDAVGTFDHIAMVVNDLDAEAARYRDIFFAKVSPTQVSTRYGYSSVFVDLGYARLRLLQSLGSGSVLTTFFGSHLLAGIHHVCYRVAEIESACGILKENGYRPLGAEDYTCPNQGKRVIFLRPPELPGPLVKLEES